MDTISGDIGIVGLEAEPTHGINELSEGPPVCQDDDRECK
uniref:Uncharacterized protein n=1 Tax=Moniliophthora roreri TaxID=221103 RepID=A0A0W0G0Q9_MONRR